jgi:hypothetical protein
MYYPQVNDFLEQAKKASTLGKQFTAILNIVNRYPSGSVPSYIYTDLLINKPASYVGTPD